MLAMPKCMCVHACTHNAVHTHTHSLSLSHTHTHIHKIDLQQLGQCAVAVRHLGFITAAKFTDLFQQEPVGLSKRVNSWEEVCASIEDAIAVCNEGARVRRCGELLHLPRLHELS